VGEIIAFKRPNPKPRPRAAQKGKTLCNNGFHKWEVTAGTPFDVKSGKLVTRYRCPRCGATRTEAR
jgi:rubredoxin